MARVPLTELIPRLVDKWSFELLHRAKMGETQAMTQVAQIQFSRRGWGRITPDAVQARRWLEYGASRGDSTAHLSLQNMRTMLAAREHELAIAREYGLIDYHKLGPDGKPIPPSEQARLAPLNFTRLVSHNPTNILEATSEEEALQAFSNQHYKSLADTLKEKKQQLLAQGDHAKAAKIQIPNPAAAPNYKRIENDAKDQRNQALKDVSAKVQEQLQYKLNTGKITQEEYQKHMAQLKQGEMKMDKMQEKRHQNAIVGPKKMN